MGDWIKKKRARPEERAFYPEEYDVSPLAKVSMVLDVLREDVQFFDTIRKALDHGRGISSEEYLELVQWRKENVLQMIESKYTDWLEHRLERASDHNEFTRVLADSRLLEPSYGHLLDVPQSKKREDPSRGRLAQKIRDLERGSGSLPSSPSPPFYEVKEEEDEPEFCFLPFTQTSLGGSSACTSVSLAAAVSMREFNDIHQATERIDWRRNVALGVKVWKEWKIEIRDFSRSFQTIYDLMKMPQLDRVFDSLGGSPQEYGGNIDGSIFFQEEEGDKERAIYPSLQESLDKMLSSREGEGKGAVAVVTIGAMSVSVFACAEEGEFLIFDSHESILNNGHCTLARARDSAMAAQCICRLCRTTTRNNMGGGGLCVGTEIVRGTYCIYIFPKKK